MFFFLQIEAENESHVFTQTKKLSDGSRLRIFTRNQRNEVGVFTYNCHLCGITSLPETALQAHIAGKKHQHKLTDEYVPDAVQFRASSMPKVEREFEQIKLKIFKIFRLS